MVSTVRGLEVVGRQLQRLGHEVTFLPGWERRGIGTLTPRAKVNHHTAGGRSGGVSPSLRICTFGRADLRNALCNTYSDRRARLYVVAALTAWHAGLGSWRGVAGNSAALGHEAENDGVGEPWSPAHLQLLVDLDRIQCEVFGYGVQMVCEHKEWSPGRKIDRAGISGDSWRRRVASGAGDVVVDVEPVDTSSKEQILMYYCKQGDKGRDVGLLQRRLNAALPRAKHIKVDKQFGPATAAAVADVAGTKGDQVRDVEVHRIELAVDRAIARDEVSKQLAAAGAREHKHTATVDVELR